MLVKGGPDVCHWSLLMMNQQGVKVITWAIVDPDLTSPCGVTRPQWVNIITYLFHNGCLWNQLRTRRCTCSMRQYIGLRSGMGCSHILGYLEKSSQWRHKSSQWRHKRNGVSNHRRLDCLLISLFRRRSKKISKLCYWPFVRGTTGDRFSSQRASNAEMFSFDEVIIGNIK